MRLNVNSYLDILSKSGLNNTDVCKSTGLSEKTLNWILDNGFIEVSTLKNIAVVLKCEPVELVEQEIETMDFQNCAENVIEWIKDEKQATLTLSQRRTINKVKKLAEVHPEECQIVAENKDGSICAHVPVSWVKISPPRGVSEERRELSRKIMQDYHLKRVTVTDNLD